MGRNNKSIELMALVTPTMENEMIVLFGQMYGSNRIANLIRVKFNVMLPYSVVQNVLKKHGLKRTKEEALVNRPPCKLKGTKHQ